MKTALITGARGFVGRHLARSLQQRGIKVCGIGHGAWTEIERFQWGVDYWLNGDISKSNLDIIQTDMGEADWIFHLAGGSSVGPSLSAPEEDFRRSVLSTAELLEWARLAVPNTKLVLASSAAVYGAGHTQAISEKANLAPYSPYGYHKRIAEELFESYGQNFGLNIAIVRLFSVYGSELKKQLLWDVCNKLTQNPTHLILGGSGNELRDWFHISDAVKIVSLASTYANPEGFLVNGGTGIPTTVREVAQQLCNIWGMNTQLEFSGNSRPGDPQYLVSDTTFASTLDFVPKISWQSGISKYVNWFKQTNNLENL